MATSNGATPRSQSDSHPNLSTIQKEEEILRRFPPPLHWHKPQPSKPFGRLRQMVFSFLCLASLGLDSLDPIWAAIRLEEEGDESVWYTGIDHTCDRLNNMLVVASLLLATTAVFITTPPPRVSIVDYTLRGPYICMLVSFGLLIGGIMAASVCVLITRKARPDWSERVLYAGRFHVYCTLVTLSYPFLSIGTAALFLSFGVLTAVWCTQDLGIHVTALILLFILPVAVGVMFGISCSTAAAKCRQKKEDPVA
ncbi:hypothetical protein MVEN_01696300 [Mycena venus]|uniref:Transmembrane protein n=1 Tax=Mycena venus TaxID=2733690 RepID=A0A8H7CQ26_9AGAR|nr:hypothetical protein MVEN_01696300 [Mycena venus]